MKDNEVAVVLIKHVTRRLEEFLDESDPSRFETPEEVHHVFSYWLHSKDRLELPVPRTGWSFLRSKP